MLRRLGAVQLDTISVLARSHELVAYARLGAIPRERIERAYWNPRRPDAFEYWSHAACVLPIEEWPYYAFRRRALQRRGVRWHQSHPEVCAQVLARIRAEGPLTATELGGAKRGGQGQVTGVRDPVVSLDVLAAQMRTRGWTAYLATRPPKNGWRCDAFRRGGETPAHSARLTASDRCVNLKLGLTPSRITRNAQRLRGNRHDRKPKTKADTAKPDTAKPG